jgi:hypothetical protein
LGGQWSSTTVRQFWGSNERTRRTDFKIEATIILLDGNESRNIARLHSAVDAHENEVTADATKSASPDERYEGQYRMK